MRPISPSLASQIYDLLVRLAGALDTADDRLLFVREVSHPYDPAAEFRFQGSLGLGGKFRNDGRPRVTPRVTCYPELCNDATKVVMERTNRALRDLFPEHTRQSFAGQGPHPA